MGRGWGVLPCRIWFPYPREFRIGSRRQGRGQRAGFGLLDRDSSVIELGRESVCLSVRLCSTVVAVMSCHQLEKGCEEVGGTWLCSHSQRIPRHWAFPTPKQFDGHDVSLRFSIIHGLAHPVAATAATATGHSSWARVERAKTFPWRASWGPRTRSWLFGFPLASPTPSAPSTIPCCCLVVKSARAGQGRHGVGVAWQGLTTLLVSLVVSVLFSFI